MSEEVILRFDSVVFQYGEKKPILDEVSFSLRRGAKKTLMGQNGAGKSTIFKLIMGELKATEGKVALSDSTSIATAAQVLDREDSDLTVEKYFAKAKVAGNLKSNINKVMEAVNLTVPTDRKVGALSGGQQARLLLAYALIQNPDILLLDEPTNHLDIMTIAWLEAYLINEFKGLLVFVSHDIKFLNKISTHVLDIDYGEVREYVGDYNLFLVKKKEIAEQKLSEKKYAEDKLAHMQKFVERFGAKASKARQAQSRVKMMEKIELPDIKNSSRMSPNFHFECKRPSGKVVLTLDKVVKTYGEKNVLNNVSFSVNKDEKVAIIGHNGIGKSTLLKIAMQALEPTSGKSEWGYETHVSYFAQDHHEQLSQSMSVLEWLTQQCPKESSASIRNVLGQVLFVKEEVESNILHISGGEAARLLVAKMMLEKPNVLVLDEPTNHLDIEGIEALIKALKAYKGTLILVSHDRHFVGQIVNRVVALSETGYKDYKGTYNQFLKYYGEDYLSQSFLAKK